MSTSPRMIMNDPRALAPSASTPHCALLEGMPEEAAVGFQRFEVAAYGNVRRASFSTCGGHIFSASLLPRQSHPRPKPARAVGKRRTRASRRAVGTARAVEIRAVDKGCVSRSASRGARAKGPVSRGPRLERPSTRPISSDPLQGTSIVWRQRLQCPSLAPV
ncbi:hypothetical protein M885DRAFT_503879 [Pelagophyceae sp. CCMP2097]|nr:hypothetical protein M885DRAFT_503879 [Pelagophyceae sp. CCMP2097]